MESLDVDSTHRLLLFSAKHPKALQKVIEDHQSYHLSHPSLVQDMSFSLALKREALSHRAFCVTDGLEDWIPVVSPRSAPREPGKLVFVFSGQGAQWAQMGRALINNVPKFRESIEGMGRFLHTLPDGPPWHLMGKSLP
jgi:acyl transferase domain-containing protein